MATFTSQHAELMEARQKQIYFNTFNQIPLLFPSLFERKSSQKGYEDRQRVAGLGTFATKPEGTPIAFDDPVSGARVRTVHTTFALGWRATMEALQDEQHGVFDKMSGDLADSGRDHMDRLAWSLVDDAFSGTTYTGLESDILCTTHTSIKTGTTTSNSGGDLALSQTTIETMLNHFSSLLSEEDRFIGVKPSLLVLHPDKQHVAYELLQTEKKVDTANNNVSTVVASRSGLIPLEVPYLSSTTAYTFHTPPGKNSLCWWDRMKLSYDRSSDPDTKDEKYYGCYRASVQFDEWRGTYGFNATA